jgi:uncharacterized protein (DUF2141 family)
MKVKITDYGLSKNSKKYFVNYRVFDLSENWLNKLKNLIEDEYKVKNGEIYITIYYDKEYFPFGSDESNYRREDFIAREEIEMTAYLLSILEE